MISRHAAARPTHCRDRFTCLLMMVFPQVCSSSFAALLLFSAGDPVRAFNNNSFSRRGSLAERVTVNNNKVFRQHVAPFTTRSTSTSQKAFLNPEYGSILLSIVETFDGSTIIDPVVVSGAFWTAFQAKFISMIIGQILATIVFGIVTSAMTSQLYKVGDAVNSFIADKVSDATFKSPPTTTTKQQQQTVTEFSAQSAPTGNRATVPANIDLGKLALCLIVDTLGTSSELIPFVGELTDVAWAPIAGIALRSLFGSNIVFALEFVEEILPFTDILPLATICWVVETFYADGDIARALQIGLYGSQAKQQPQETTSSTNDGVIDVEISRGPTKRLISGRDNDDDLMRRM